MKPWKKSRELPHSSPPPESPFPSSFRLNKSDQPMEDLGHPMHQGRATLAQLGTSQLPAPPCSSAYRGSHESGWASNTGVSLGKESRGIETGALSSLYPTHSPMFSPFSSSSPAVPGWREVLWGRGKTPSWTQPLTGCGPCMSPPLLSGPQFSFFWVQNRVDLEALSFAVAPSLSDAPAKSDPRGQPGLNPSMSATGFLTLA